LQFISATEAETEEAGASLAAGIKGGEVIALSGGLGAGKTVLTRGLARGLGVAERVTSPTYTIVNTYCGQRPRGSAGITLYHIDAYRLSGGDDFYSTGAGDFLGKEGTVSMIEWSEKVEDFIPKDAIKIQISILRDGKRKIEVQGGQHG
jgi:tRNA threonylcarbamoyladenosine biosynthesis protein TsaE